MAKQKPPPPYEAEEQETLFEWTQWVNGKWPELDYMHAIPNGGSRHPAEAVKLKKQGVKPGVPDIFLPAPRGPYHGLYIEMKRAEGGKVSGDQQRFIDYLLSQDYAVFVCYSCDSAMKAITQYMNLPSFTRTGGQHE